MAARGSIGTPVTRLMRVTSVTTCAARANAVAVAAASPAVVSTATFDAHASQTATAPAAIASVDATTAGSGSQSTTTRSAPSRAASAVSATTIATGSPTKRTRSTGRGRGFATKNGEPSGLLSGTSCGFVGTGRCDIALSPSATRSAPVNTASTPGLASVAAISMRTMYACACGERTIDAYA